MIGEIMRKCNNYFIRTSEEVTANFNSSTKKITFETDLANDLLVGQYIMVYGSILNDSVQKVTNIANKEITIEGTLLNEANATIYLYGLAIPKDFLDIVVKIKSDFDSGKYSGVKSIKRGDTSIDYGDNSTSNWWDDYKKSLSPYIKVRLI